MINKGDLKLVDKSKMVYADVESVTKAPIVTFDDESEPMGIDTSRSEERDEEILADKISEEDSEEGQVPGEGKIL